LTLHAFRRLLADVPSARLLLAGDGPERSALQGLADRLGVARRVAFLGQRDDVPLLLALADVVLSGSEGEGFPLNILEAMAAGRPVIAARLPAFDDFVVDGETAVLVPHDPRSMADAVGLMLSRPDLAERVGRSGRLTARRFTTAATAERLLDVYGAVLAQRRRTGAAAS
jgi:glycosyltransferase involved in cell wall biosynthesis